MENKKMQIEENNLCPFFSPMCLNFLEPQFYQYLTRDIAPADCKNKWTIVTLNDNHTFEFFLIDVTPDFIYGYISGNDHHPSAYCDNKYQEPFNCMNKWSYVWVKDANGNFTIPVYFYITAIDTSKNLTGWIPKAVFKGVSCKKQPGAAQPQTQPKPQGPLSVQGVWDGTMNGHQMVLVLNQAANVVKGSYQRKEMFDSNYAVQYGSLDGILNGNIYTGTLLEEYRIAGKFRMEFSNSGNTFSGTYTYDKYPTIKPYVWSAKKNV